MSSANYLDRLVENGAVVKNSPASAGYKRDLSLFDPWVGKIAWRKTWQPTPVFLPKKSHGLSSKESDMTEVTEHTHTDLGKLANILEKAMALHV